MRLIRLVFWAACLGCLVACSSSEWKKSADGSFEYQVFKSGKGTGAIEFGDLVRLDYQMLYENTVLESSFGKTPIELSIPAKEYRRELEEAILYAEAGDSLSVRIRFGRVSHLFEKYRANIPNNGVLMIHYRIQSVKKHAEVEAELEKQYAEKNGFESVAAMRSEQSAVLQRSKSLDSLFGLFAGQKTGWVQHQGVSVYFLQPSATSPTRLAVGDTVRMYYAACVLPEAKIFDTNMSRADRFVYVLGASPNLISALNNSLVGLARGDRFLMRVPADLGYGEAGSEPVVGKNKELGYYVEIL